uniref:Putative deah-box rna helicase n=1 Tax=Rhipicephalus pulchellus TaxID=72859 RepID=L7LZS2_RHIPC
MKRGGSQPGSRAAHQQNSGHQRGAARPGGGGGRGANRGSGAHAGEHPPHRTTRGGNSHAGSNSGNNQQKQQSKQQDQPRGGHTRGDRGRVQRGRFHSRGRGGGAKAHPHGSDRNILGGGALSAGQNLLSFKRALRRKTADDETSMVSESDSCAFSVSDFGDAMSECGFNDGQFYDGDKNFTEERDMGEDEYALSKLDDFEDLMDAVSTAGNEKSGGADLRAPQPVLGAPAVLAPSASVGWISVFWDIENCAVPSGVPAYDIVRKVRQTFYKNLREADFLVACDIGRMKPAVVVELTEAHVTLMHVPGGQKNAADEKLRSELRRFSDAYKLTGSRVVLISGDVDFAAEIHEIRYKNLIHVALIHNDQAKRSLTDTANQSIRYAEFVANIRKDERAKEAKASVPTGQRKPLTQKPPQVGKVNNAQDPAGVCKVAAGSAPSGQKQAVKKLSKESQKDSVRVTGAILDAEARTAPVAAGGGANGICASNKKETKTNDVAATEAVLTKVGLLVRQQPRNLQHWKSFLSKLNIPQDFSLEIGKDKDVICLVYSSNNKSKKAVAALNKQINGEGDVVKCLGILSDKTVRCDIVRSPEGPLCSKNVKDAISYNEALRKFVRQDIAALKGNDQGAKETRLALEKLGESYAAQLNEFMATLGRISTSSQDAHSITTKEAVRLLRASPLYSVKSRLFEALEKRKVVFLVAPPGSASCLEVPSYLRDLGFRVLSIQPSAIAAEQCAKYAASLSGIGAVECWRAPGQQVSAQSTVVFTTARRFFHEFMRCGTTLAGFQAIVVDALQEDSAYQRIVLAVLRMHFLPRVHLVLSGSDSYACSSVQQTFCLGDEEILKCYVQFPVEVIWKERPTNLNVAAASVAATIEFCQKCGKGGDIVVFLPSLADAFLADALLKYRKDAGQLEETVRHEVLFPGNTSLSTFSSPSLRDWRVVFAVEYPDAIASTLRARCVIDSGLTRTVVYRNGVLVAQLAYISEAEAEERKALVGHRLKGICYRLYNRDVFASSLSVDEKNSRFIEDIVLRLARQVGNVAPYLEKIPKEFVTYAKKALAGIGALDSNGRLTDLGAKLCENSLEPRLGKLVLGSLDKTAPLNAVLTSALAYEDLLATYRPLNKDGTERKVQRAEGDCVFSRITDLYKNWLAVPKKMKSAWCEVNSVNETFISHLHSTVLAIQSEFDALRGKNLNADSTKQDKDVTVTVAELLAESFPQGLLQASERGFSSPTLGTKLQVSPLSVLGIKAGQTKNVVCCLFSRVPGARKLQLLNFSSLPDRDDISETKADTPLSSSKLPHIQKRFGPIGNLIWNQQFNTQRVLHSIQDKLGNEGHGKEGSLEMDATAQCIVVRGSAQYCIEARQYLQSIVTDQVAKLARKDREALLTPPDSPYSTHPVLAVIGVGGRLDEILSPTNFRTLVVGDVKVPLADFRKLVNSFGDIVQYWFLKKDNAFQITYKTAKEADAAYVSLSKHDGVLAVSVKGQALAYRDEQKHRRPAFHAQVSLPRRRCTGIAFAALPDQASMDRIAGSLPLRLQLDGAVVTCERSKNAPCELFIKGLAPAIDQTAVEKLLRSSLPVGLKSVRLIREPHLETTAPELRALEDAVRGIFEREAGTDVPKLSLQKPKNTDYVFKGWMSFEDAVAAQRACALLKGAPVSTDVSQGGDSAVTLPLTVHTLVQETFFFPRLFFAAIQDRVEAELRRQEGIRPEDNLKCDATPCGPAVVRVSLRANNLHDFQKAVQLFNRLISTEAALFEESVQPEIVAAVVNVVTPEGGVYVIRKPGSMRLVGDEELVSAVVEVLKKRTKAQGKYKRKKLVLVGDDFSALRSFVGKFGHDPWELAKECKLEAAQFDANFEAIDVVGLDAAIGRAEQLISQLPRRPVEAESTSRSERCPICREQPCPSEGDEASVDGHRLELCGHWHCRSCLLLVFKQAPLPLACFEEDCASPWAMADIVHVAGNDSGLLSDLARRSFESTVASDAIGRWCPCPIPECHFALDAHRDTEEQGVRVLGDVHICPGCTNAVCFRCRSLYHYGMSCTAFRASMLPSNGTTANKQSWLAEDPGKHLVCPPCKTNLVRQSASKVDACWACRRLFCWHCHQSFEDDAAAARGHRTQSCVAAHR